MLTVLTAMLSLRDITVLVGVIEVTRGSNIGVYKLKNSAVVKDIKAAIDCARCNADDEKCKEIELEEVVDDFTAIPNMDMRVLRVDSVEVTWFEAKKRCSFLGADLLTLETPEIRRQFVSSDTDVDLFKHWTSMSNTGKGRVLKWSTGHAESVTDLSITNPRFYPQTCIYIHLGRFGTLPCGRKKGYTCQKNTLKKRSTCK